MSANFLNTSGGFAGVDFHVFIALGPEGVPVPTPEQPHIVGARHKDHSREWRIARTVTTDGNPVFRSGWAMMDVEHIPVTPLPPHPLELVWIVAVIATSSSQPPLAVHEVTGEGLPLLTEIDGFTGYNVDCSEVPVPSIDINLNSVRTTPTLGDIIAAILGAAWRMLFGRLLGKGLGKLWGKLASDLEEAARKMLGYLSSALVRTVLNWLASFAVPWADPIVWAFNKWIAPRVQRLADSPSPLLQ